MTDCSKAYKWNVNNVYDGVVECQVDPKETALYGRTVYLLPANATYIEPLPEKEGFQVKWDGDKWFYEEIEQEPEPYEPTEEDKRAAEINELKQKLKASDYAVIKIAEGAAEREEYAELILQRAEWRARINELEEESVKSEAE